MSKTSTDPMRHALNGPTMGTRWSALFYTEAGFDPEPVRHALQAEMDEVDAQTVRRTIARQGVSIRPGGRPRRGDTKCSSAA